MLTGLNAAQHEAVTTDAAPLCILAGAGSGKTRVLTRRIAHRVLEGTADAEHVLALTFTRKAAGELRSRLGQLGVRGAVVAGTFHAIAYAQLRQRWEDRGEAQRPLLQSKFRLLGPIVNRVAPGGRVLLVDVAAEIEWAKARMVPPSQYEVEAPRAARTPPLAPVALAAVYEEYETAKVKRGVVDFDDLLGLCARFLQTEEQFAETQRWKFRHLFVDEFQDVNLVQFQLLKGWLGDRNDLCVVGDPNQAIYSWNGADPRLLNRFPQLFPGATSVRLDENYRSAPQILAVANAVLEAGDQTTGVPRIRTDRPDGRIPSVRSYATALDEARAIAVSIRRSHNTTRPWSHFAVLTRTNAQAVDIERALRDAQVPFRVIGGGTFLNLPEIKGALAELSRSPAAVPFAHLVSDLQEMADEEANDERRLSLQTLARLAHEYAALDRQGTAASFSEWMTITVKSEEPDERGDAVEVVTFHGAKGLEWPVVYVTGMEKGLVPIARAETDEAEAEERRLLYVAITRAQDELHCSWARRRTFGERQVYRSPSPWLATIEAAVRALEAGGPDADWRQFLATERTKLRAVDGGRGSGKRGAKKGVAGGLGANPDPDILTALKLWRARAAKAANVPAYVIFHDTTLAAIAELRPETGEALLAVPGLGPVKAERYGEALLAVVAEHRRSATA